VVVVVVVVVVVLKTTSNLFDVCSAHCKEIISN